MKRLILPLLLALLMLPLAGCRGGGWVFKGTHESQDKALLERLADRYPEMSFSCTGQVEGARHRVLAGDGTEFPAWTAPTSKGRFQVMEHYLEEWLAAQGFYREMEEELAGLGFEWEYNSYNYYDRHFSFRFGELDEAGTAQAAGALAWAKDRFDSLYQGFQESTGCQAPLLYFHGSFTLGGREHSGRFYLSMREGGSWDLPYAYDDYQAVLQNAIERAKADGDTPDPNIGTAD